MNNPIQTEKAVKALLAHHLKEQEKRKVKLAEKAEGQSVKGKGKGKEKAASSESLIADSLVEKDEYIWMMVGFRKIPEIGNSHKPRRLQVRHRIFKEDAEVCVITKDPQRTFKDIVKEKKLEMVTKVIGISKLKTKYKPYEAKRQLCDSYDIFMADDSVVHFLPKALGKPFFEKKKTPIPIALKPSTMEKEILKALNSTYVFLGKGASTSIKVGRTSQSAKEIAENVQDVIQGLQGVLPKKGQTIQSISLKTPRSVALPIYNKIPDAPAVIDA